MVSNVSFFFSLLLHHLFLFPPDSIAQQSLRPTIIQPSNRPTRIVLRLFSFGYSFYSQTNQHHSYPNARGLPPKPPSYLPVHTTTTSQIPVSQRESPQVEKDYIMSENEYRYAHICYMYFVCYVMHHNILTHMSFFLLHCTVYIHAHIRKYMRI